MVYATAALCALSCDPAYPQLAGLVLEHLGYFITDMLHSGSVLLWFDDFIYPFNMLRDGQIPYQHLDLITTPVYEDKHLPTQRIAPKLVRYYPLQPVETLAHIYRLQPQIVPGGAGQHRHDNRARR